MAPTTFALPDPNQYMYGLGGSHRSEAVDKAIPDGVIMPRKHELGLCMERITGGPFTAASGKQRQGNLYRILPSMSRQKMEADPSHALNVDYEQKLSYHPATAVWPPRSIEKDKDFLGGLRWIGGVGCPRLRSGFAYYSFTAGADMPEKEAFFNADGDVLIVPQEGTLDIKTELGILRVRPREFCVLPAGIAWHVSLPDGPIRGYMLEIFEGQFQLPEKAVMGGFGLANEHYFQVPTARYETWDGDFTIRQKFNGQMYQASGRGSVFNVVAWQGTYFPYKFDLGRFQPVGAILEDHLDPSVMTVLTCPSARAGTPLVEFAAFTPRFIIGETTFRPAPFHRNAASEFAGLISGGFDEGAIPEPLWGLSLIFNNYSPHGPLKDGYMKETNTPITPEAAVTRVPDHHFGFVFESSYMIGMTDWAAKDPSKLSHVNLSPEKDPLQYPNDFRESKLSAHG